MDEKKYILVVEDDYGTRDLIMQVIEEDFYDYLILSAENGKEAIEIINSTKNVCACITDGRMPLMDGFLFVSTVRKLYPEIGIVFLTACSTEYKKADAYYLGVDEYLEKPFDIDTLSNAVRTAIANYNERKLQL